MSAWRLAWISLVHYFARKSGLKKMTKINKYNRRKWASDGVWIKNSKVIFNAAAAAAVAARMHNSIFPSLSYLMKA